MITYSSFPFFFFYQFIIYTAKGGKQRVEKNYIATSKQEFSVLINALKNIRHSMVEKYNCT